MRFLYAFAAFLFLAAPAFAGSEHVQPADAVPGHQGVTYLDLVKLMLPDVVPEGNQHAATPPRDLRHVDPEFSNDIPMEKGTFSGAEISPARVGGKDRLVVLVDFGTSPGVNGLAMAGLFGFDNGPALLDMADLALDQYTSFHDEGVFPVSANDSVMVTGSYHNNSNQAYAAITLLGLAGDRIEKIDTLWLLNDHFCGYERTQDAAFSAYVGAALFADITATVTDTITREDEDCGDYELPEASTREITDVYRWHLAERKYRPDTDAFEKLAEENAERY